MNNLKEKASLTIKEVIEQRRSIKKFKKDNVPTELVLDLLNTAVWAPNHGLREPWRFILLKDEGRKVLADAILKKNEELRPKWEYVMNVPLHLVVVMKEDPRQKQWEENFAAVCTMVQNLQLAGWEQGIGMIWKTNPLIHDPNFREKVGVQQGEKIIGFLHIGYPDAIPNGKDRTPAEELLMIIDTDTAI
ncbi:nitroreductase family protein [Heyndrickxia sp. NPDC080065]|uniref:nitroreductase family protein n=1 Tax=Heyndrickxia sp. NPDC080065 TaxID=3390568 RepID=UPI003D084D2F